MIEPSEAVRLMQTRYTTKHYSGEKLPREKVEALLEVLRLSPSSVNSQPWHFFVASSDAARERLAAAFADFNRERVTRASDLIVFAVREKLDDAFLKTLLAQEVADGRFTPETADDSSRRHFVALNHRTPESGLAWESRQAYIALGCLLVAAEAMGVDSTCLEGADFDELDRLLGLREKGLRSIVAVSLGVRRPDDSNAVRPKSRLPREAVVTTVE